ncbi:MAG TPA: DUF1800 family protein [Pseudolabrys sp.]|nr:DUF1800 family protein [Pseudolabrys sp.]
MALDSRAQAAVALNRFGFTPKAGVPTDPRAALVSDLANPSAGQIANKDLLSVGEAARAAFAFRQERKAKQLEKAVSTQADMARNPSKTDMAKPDAKSGAAQAPGVPQQIYLREAKARLDAALSAETGFVEKLVWFWSNHFCVSADKGPVRALCGAFEREAIRPHVRGKFADLLLAVETHPAMLLYLDNAQSIGPNSFAGQRRGKGINENLAREIMELHTVGVRSGYSQADVTNFAKVITGWSIVPPRLERGGEFMFNDRLHEPGTERIMGQDYGDGGFEQGRAVLLALARRPATAKHVAVKLARHFVADEPPSALVEKLAKRFHDTDGDLMEVSKTLVTASEAWDVPPSKIRRPSEWLVNSLRALNLTPPDVRPFLQAQNLLGEPLWRPPAPNGFSDDSAPWMDGLAQRLDIANNLSRRVGEFIDPDMVADRALGPLLSKETKQTVALAESRPQAIALLLMAPEFQRR